MSQIIVTYKTNMNELRKFFAAFLFWRKLSLHYVLDMNVPLAKAFLFREHLAHSLPLKELRSPANWTGVNISFLKHGGEGQLFVTTAGEGGKLGRLRGVNRHNKMACTVHEKETGYRRRLINQVTKRLLRRRKPRILFPFRIVNNAKAALVGRRMNARTNTPSNFNDLGSWVRSFTERRCAGSALKGGSCRASMYFAPFVLGL